MTPPPLSILTPNYELSIFFFLMFDHLPLKMGTSFMNELHSRDMAALTIIGDVMYFIADQNSDQQNSALKYRH